MGPASYRWVIIDVKPVDFHPQLSHKGRLMDGALVSVGSL
jgi:hypothetical protein